MSNFMRTIIQLCSLLTVMAGAGAQANAPASAEEILQRADNYRLQTGAAKVVSEVEQFERGELRKAHQYNVYIRPQRMSLVVFKAASEAGQKMLMLEDNYWLLMPNSRRPIRITPMQKLLGEASVGDVSTLTWSEDYEGTIVGPDSLDGASVIKLELQAKTRGASYHGIHLWVDAESYFPRKAELYLKSGKLAKVATFNPLQDKQGLRVGSMVLQDSIQPEKTTLIHYRTIAAYSLPDKFYNPAYLSRHSGGDNL